MTVNILSLNAYQFPPLIAPFASKIGNQSNRVSMLAEKILHLKESPDVIILQEIWSKPARSKLFKKIKEEYPYKLEDSYGALFTFGSGLALYSKHPIEKAKMYRFKHWRGHHEFFAQKGFTIAKINALELPVYIVNTHLQAGAKYDKFLSPYYKLSTTEVRFEQLKQIGEELQRFIEQDDPSGSLNDKIILLGGDFNISENGAEYQNIFKALPSAKATLEKTSDLTGSAYDANGTPMNKIIDHIFSLGKPIEGKSAVIKDMDYSISDHLAVQGQFTLPKGI